MKNKIMKSYLKKILRSEAFISVVVVFVLALGIIGTSYALYMDVDKDTEYQLVKTGDLSISLQDGTDIISLDEVMPLEDSDVINGTETPTTYIFSIMNTGTYNALYDIKLELLSGNTVSKEHISFLLCKESCEGKKVDDVRTLDELEDMLIHSDKILKGTNSSDTYIVKVWLNSGYNGDVARNLKLKVVVEARNESIHLLADTVMNDDRITKNSGIPNFSNVEQNEVGMYKAEDDYGDSWYFRGKQSYNYVNFAGLRWRIVRINGDGSIRLILDGTLDKMNLNGTPIVENPELINIDSDGKVPFKIITNDISDNAYIGYMYGDNNASTYDLAHKNVYSSDTKKYLDKFYELYIGNYENILADTLFCGDKSLATGFDKVNSGYSTIDTKYAAYQRLVETSIPTLMCAEGEVNNYSRYTSNLEPSETTSKGISINNDLTYPIALLSADEVVMAGGKYKVDNTSYYLHSGDIKEPSYWWTMTPYQYITSENAARLYFVREETFSLHDFKIGNGYYARPVINLKSDVGFKEGDGTINSPYEIITDYKN